MVKSDLVIAGSNFIFSHICENYKKYFNNKNRKLLVIFRGINSEYFSQKNVSNEKLQKQIKEWQVDKNKFIILLPGRLTNWKGQIVFIEAINILNQQTYVKPFLSIKL
jgi:glycosyltransferase involved in cell wall biosynthesis